MKYLNLSSRKTRVCLLCTFNTMAVDDLATLGARASTVMVLTYLSSIRRVNLRDAWCNHMSSEDKCLFHKSSLNIELIGPWQSSHSFWSINSLALGRHGCNLELVIFEFILRMGYNLKHFLWKCHQAIIWTNAGLLSIGLLRLYSTENLIKMQQFSMEKMN